MQRRSRVGGSEQISHHFRALEKPIEGRTHDSRLHTQIGAVIFERLKRLRRFRAEAAVFVEATGIIAFSFVLLFPFLVGDAAHANDFEIEVSSGSSSADPIDNALKQAREHRNQSPTDRIVIQLSPGTFRRRIPVELGSTDSGRPEAPLIIRGASSGTTVISGAVVVHEHLPRASFGSARGVEGLTNARVASSVDLGLVKPIDVIRQEFGSHAEANRVELFQGDRRLRLARWPKKDFSQDAKLEDSLGADKRIHFKIPQEQLQRWEKEENLWIGGYFTHDWAYETAPVAGFDSQNSSLIVDHLSTAFPVKVAPRFFVFNVMDELNGPGYYVIDHGRQELTYIPFHNSTDVESAVANELLSVKDASNLVIENISFEKSLGAGATISSSSSVKVANCFIGHVGGDALLISGSKDIVVDRSVITDVSGYGVILRSGDRKTLVPANLEVRDSIITNFGLDGRTYRPGVAIEGVGNSVVGSLIANGPHAGIIISGNDNLIENNELSELVQESDDAGAIYMGRDWTLRGNVIRGNFVHDIGKDHPATAFGIYLDDQISETVVSNNFIVGTRHSVMIGGGRDNFVRDNVFVAPERSGIWVDNRGQTWQKEMSIGDGALITKLRSVNYISDPWRSRYPKLYSILGDELGAPKGNELVGNIAFGAPVFKFENDTTRSYVKEVGSVALPIDPEISHLLNSTIIARDYLRSANINSEMRLADRRKSLCDLLFYERAGLSPSDC